MSVEHEKYGIICSIPADVYYGRRDWTPEELEQQKEPMRQLARKLYMQKEKAALEAIFGVALEDFDSVTLPPGWTVRQLPDEPEPLPDVVVQRGVA